MLIRKKKSLCYKNKMKEIEYLKSRKPRDFWKYFKSNKSAHNTDIPLEEFETFFDNLCNNISTSNEEADDICATNDFSADNVCFPELDLHINQKEILDAVKRLKRKKTNGSNFL